MKLKSYFKYLILTIIIFSMIILKEYLEKLFQADFAQDFCFNYWYIVLSLFAGVLIGILLGLDQLISEMRKEGTWKINFPKIIFVGLPSLFFSLSYIWIYSNVQVLKIKEIIVSLFLNIGHVSLFQLIFGYVIVTSLNKHNEKM